MTCPECHKEITDNGICCDDCKCKVIEQLNNLEEMCHSTNVGCVHLAYGLIKEWPIFHNVQSTYGMAWSGTLNFPSINQLNKFIVNALEEYEEEPGYWSSDIDFYRKEGLCYITFVKKLLKS